MWKLFVIVCSVLLVGCKGPKPKPLDKVKNQNISINFKVDYKPSLYPTHAPYSNLMIELHMLNEKGSHIEIGSNDQMRAYLNGTEYLLEPRYCFSFLSSPYFCGYRFPYLSDELVTNLVQPLTIELEIRRSKGQLITATASLPHFFTMTSSVSTEKKFDPLIDDLQVTWASTIPVKQIRYYVGHYYNKACNGFSSKTPQVTDTYIQFIPNEFNLDAAVCRPMSNAAVVVDTEESITAMQTNIAVASANITLNQTVALRLLYEPYVPQNE